MARRRWSKPGAVRALALGALLAACGGAGKDGGGDDISVGLTTAGGATTLAAGDTLVIKADVNNTSSTMEVTWELSGPSCPGGCGTIAPTTTDFAIYSAPSSVASDLTVTVTARSVENPSKSGSVALTVLGGFDARSLLRGPYAFLLQGFDPASGNGIAAVGSFTADGHGNVTSGEVDYYFGPTVAGHAASLGGSYAVAAADHRGTLTLAVGGASVSFAIAIGKVDRGIATRGAMTEMDPLAAGSTVLSGSMWLQDASAFTSSAVAGPYAFVLNGWNGSGPREAMGGTVHSDGAGHLDAGLLDDVPFGGTPLVETAWSGTYAAPSSSGRTLLTAPALTGPSGTAVAYVVAAQQLVAMIWDPGSGGRVFSGSMLAQHGPFGLDSLRGDCAAYQTANYDQPSYETLTTSVLSLFTADGAGTLSLTSADLFAGGNWSRPTGISYGYAVAANGHATIYTAPSTPGGKWYLTGPNEGLMLGFDVGVSVGGILSQSAGPFTAASISGSYFGTQAPGGAAGSTFGSGVATSAGTGTLTTTMDRNGGGMPVWGQTASDALAVDPNGRVAYGSDEVIYVVSPTLFLILMDHATFYPVLQLFER